MIVKHIFLSALLIVPLGAYASNVVRSRADIIAELENLNGKIAEKEVIINAIVDNFNVVARALRDILSDESEYFSIEFKEFSKEFAYCAQEFFAAILTPESIAKFLAYEFVGNKANTKNSKDVFRRVKFTLLRWKIEYFLLNKLFDQYQQCVSELAQFEK